MNDLDETQVCKVKSSLLQIFSPRSVEGDSLGLPQQVTLMSKIYGLTRPREIGLVKLVWGASILYL